MDRRLLLKALAMAPAALVGANAAPALSKCTASGKVDLYFAGLFLMEFQNDRLVIVTPKYKHHGFCISRPGAPPLPMPEYVVLLDSLVPGDVTSFSPNNLRFPANAVKPKGGYVIDPQNPTQHHHRCTMILPRPCSLEVYNCEDPSHFHPVQNSKIGDLIKQQAGSNQLGSITHLQYNSRDGSSWSAAYLALHQPLTLGTVNEALWRVRNICGDAFDLQISDIPPQNCSGTLMHCPDWNQLTYFFARNLNPREKEKVCNLHVDVASCPQFGITG